MRRSFDGLVMMVNTIIRQDPLSGHLFVFVNRKGDRLKLLYWDRDGLAIWYKRLEKGVFSLPTRDDSHLITHRQLSMILEGIEYRDVRLKRRFQLKI
jgi:transposase